MDDKTNNLISVIMPTYNHGKHIGNAITSVLNQTHTNFELIIVDNYSKDETEEVIKRFQDDRIKYFKFSNNGVIAASRNYGIKHSKGEYIAFLDSDDIWKLNKIEKQLPHLNTFDISGVASNADYKSKTPYFRRSNFGRSKKGYINYRYSDILNSNPIITSSVILKKKMLKKAGLFDENKDFFAVEDWDLWLRISREGFFRVLEEPLVTYLVERKRGYKASIISKNALKVLTKHVDRSFVKNEDLVESKVYLYMSIARNLLEFDTKQSREYYKMAIKNTKILRKKIKSILGIIISFQPIFILKKILLVLYKTDRLLFNLKENLLKIKTHKI